MSADKRKRWDRAMAFLRGLNSRANFELGTMTVNRPLGPVARYCIKRGLATLRREPRSDNASRTIFDTGLRGGKHAPDR